MSNKPIPTVIDQPPIYIFWSQDEFIPVVAVLSAGFFFGWLLTAAVISFVVLRFYRKIRDSHPRGYFFHWTWWIGIGGARNSFSIHNPFIRKFYQ